MSATVSVTMKDWLAKIDELDTLVRRDSRNRASEPFGYGRLEGTLAASAHLPADGIKKELLKRLDSFRQGQDFGDDVTLVVAKII